MKRVGLVAKRGQFLGPLAQELIGWLRDRGVAAAAEEELLARLDLPGLKPLAEADYPAQDLIVVLGGDGTMLHAARQVGPSQVPLLGVNLGGLGYLTAVTIGELFPTLELIQAGRLRPQERMRLAVRVNRAGETIFEALVLNDAVINKGALARVVDLTAAIDGQFLTAYRADGLIVSTPTGSTAYNLSAGGPILHPSLSAMILTPICPFTLANRPLVVADSAEITLELAGHLGNVYLTCDGQRGRQLGAGDKIVIRRSTSLRLFTSPSQDHFSILRTKLGWGASGNSCQDQAKLV